MDIFFYDSVKKRKVKFVPIKETNVKIYVCGPTVYDDSHLGHARSAVSFDMVHRVLKENNFNVSMSKNFTDIDDKIIKKMYETSSTLEEITNKYISEYKKDMLTLQVLDNTIEPKATDNLSAMIDMINDLLQKDIAYTISDGVYFDTSKDESYGTLSHRVADENNQARIEVHKEKKNQADFVLWKFQKKNDVVFEATFGNGRPGWHIECSAMINKHLAYNDEGYQIDIHGGGADLLFPHHENEASQTRCTAKQELAKYWMHNAFVNIDGEKMSKSLGNSFFLKDVLKFYSGEVVRFYLLTAHYRTDFNFNEDDLSASKKRLDKLYRLKKRIYLSSPSSINKKFKQDLLLALNDDINTSKALAVIDELISSSNDKLDKNEKDKSLKKELLSNIEFINNILGIGLYDAYEYFQFGIDKETLLNINQLIEKRVEAKKNKNFELSDALRDELHNLNISIMDTPFGIVWERI